MGLENKFVMMVVDDVQENLDAAIEGLSKYVSRVVTAENYMDAISLIDLKKPDFAVIDLNFPYERGGEVGKNGFKLQEILNQKYVPNSILTAGIAHHSGTETSDIIVGDFKIPMIGSNFNGLPGDLCKSLGIPFTKDDPVAWDYAFKEIFFMSKDDEFSTQNMILYDVIRVLKDCHEDYVKKLDEMYVTN